MRVLLLGGTAEARALASALVADEVDVTSSLAGRVARPRLPAGALRVGGFGGVDGLRSALAEYDVVVDATHPFAATISGTAATACAETGTPLLRLARPGWSTLPGADTWHWVTTSEEAAVLAHDLADDGAGPVFLTTGRQTLERFVPALRTSTVLARVVDPVDVHLPEGWTVLLARGPYTVEAERTLMTEHGIAVLVTKDSGGDLVRAKLDVAVELGLEVVVVRRPDGPAGVESVSDVTGAQRWLREQRTRG